MSTLQPPSPIAQMIAFSLFNQNAYDEKNIYSLIMNNQSMLEDCFIPIQQVNNYSNFEKQSVGNQLLGKIKHGKVLEGILDNCKDKNSTNPQWDDLLAPNVFALSLLHKNFVETLSVNDQHILFKKAKVRFFIGKLVYNNDIFKYKDNKEKLVNLLSKEDIDKAIETNFLPFDMTYKDFSCLILLGKIKEYNFKLQEHDLIYFNEDEKELINTVYNSKKSIIPTLLNILDNQSISSFIFKKIGVIPDYKLDRNNLPYYINDIVSENNLTKVLNNLSNNQKLKIALTQDINLIKEVWPLIWNAFTDVQYDFNPLSFTQDPNQIDTVLYKLGILKEDFLSKDKESGYFLSHFILPKATTKILDKLMDKGFFSVQWLKKHTNSKTWEEIIKQKTSHVYIAIQDNLNVSVFDVAPKEMHGLILEEIIDRCSDYNINEALESPNFNINLINRVIKLKNKPSTLLHKLLIKGHEKAFINALSKGADYTIPVGNSILDYMENKVKYEALLQDLKPLLMHNELQKKIPQKSAITVKKLKI